ncbi:MAG: hypothetical protein GC164_08390 [Phycisphaera sp.]|nr:hypothetical protein [Phycisphaera sp.]
MIQEVNIMMFPHAYVIHPYSLLQRGMQGVDPVEAYSHDVKPRILAKVVLRLMRHSHDNWPPDPGIKPQSRKILKAAKVKRWRDIDPIAMVGVTRLDSGIIMLVPMARKGLGHSGIGGYVIRLRPPVLLDRLAKAMAKAISISEASYRPKRRARKSK